jgi:hypothetical protein
MEERVITNCKECPFCNHDSEFGRDGCNLNTDIQMTWYEYMSDDKVHDDCPLKNGEVTVKFKP